MAEAKSDALSNKGNGMQEDNDKPKKLYVHKKNIKNSQSSVEDMISREKKRKMRR